MPNLLLVMLGGALGAGARHLAGVAGLRWLGPGFPWVTLFVNLLGSLLIGLLAGWLVLKGGSEQVRLFLAVGILGGFTTADAPQRVIERYRGLVTGHGYSAEQQQRGGDQVLGGTRGDSAYYLIVTPQGNGSDVALIVNNGR